MSGIFIGGGGPERTEPQELLLRLGNRHGLIAGATGTGKTVTMQIMAEGFSAAGVPVVLTDVKGDLGGMALAGGPDQPLHEAFRRRADTIGLDDIGYRAFPVVFWDLFGDTGHPVRATVAEMGPLLLSRMLDLTDAQEGVMNVAFRLSDEEALPLLDLKDLQAIIRFVGEHARDLSLRYGNVAPASVGAIQRRLLVLEDQGAERFFGEPALELRDLMATNPQGLGRINILSSEKLMRTPRLYGTFLLWLLSQLFEDLPEVGDPDRPKLVFFFDEAHLLFSGAPKVLVDKIERVARLIRSKGVGVYFVTQNPDDVAVSVLAQLGNRVQHALRAFTARDAQALRRAAQTYRPNPRLDIADTIRDVGTGEALTSFLEAKGNPGVAERTLIRPPASRLGAIDAETRAGLIAASPLAGKYDITIDRDSAYERLKRRAAEAAADMKKAEEASDREREFTAARRYDAGTRGRAQPIGGATRPAPRRRGDSVTDAFAKSFARQLGSRSGQAIARGILGGLFKGR